MSDAFARSLTRALRAERARVGMSQADLADRLGWSRQSVTALEAGTRNLYAHELPDVCRGLGVTLSALLIGATAEDRDALGL